MGSVLGHKRGRGAHSQDMEEDACARSGSQRQAAEAGKWQVQEIYRWAVLRTGGGGGEWLQIDIELQQ